MSTESGIMNEAYRRYYEYNADDASDKTVRVETKIKDWDKKRHECLLYLIRELELYK